jgi:hypothetical protein
MRRIVLAVLLTAIIGGVAGIERRRPEWPRKGRMLRRRKGG